MHTKVSKFRPTTPSQGDDSGINAQDARRHHLDGEAMALMLQTVKDLSHTLRALNDKVREGKKMYHLSANLKKKCIFGRGRTTM
jgi:hypothetical protein